MQDRQKPSAGSRSLFVGSFRSLAARITGFVGSGPPSTFRTRFALTSSLLTPSLPCLSLPTLSGSALCSVPNRSPASLAHRSHQRRQFRRIELLVAILVELLHQSSDQLCRVTLGAAGIASGLAGAAAPVSTGGGAWLTVGPLGPFLGRRIVGQQSD